jgi:hypothetical protein
MILHCAVVATTLLCASCVTVRATVGARVGADSEPRVAYDAPVESLIDAIHATAASDSRVKVIEPLSGPHPGIRFQLDGSRVELVLRQIEGVDRFGNLRRGSAIEYQVRETYVTLRPVRLLQKRIDVMNEFAATVDHGLWASWVALERAHYVDLEGGVAEKRR